MGWDNMNKPIVTNNENMDKTNKISKSEWGELIYSYSKREATIGEFILGGVALALMIFLSLGIFYHKYLIGIVAILCFFGMLIGFWERIREIRDNYDHFDVYENGVWFPVPTYWFWQKTPPEDRYFRHFDDITSIKIEYEGPRAGYHFRINTKSEGEIFFALNKKPGERLKKEIEKAMEEYRIRKTGGRG
jgi:hypothetical protein